MADVLLWKYCAWLALFSSPAVPLAFAWRRLLSGGRPRRFTALFAAAIASVSLIWFDAAMANYRFLGPLYGRLHYGITGGNLLAVFVCGVYSAIASISPVARAPRLATALACIALSLEWTFLGIANR
jgi:hypothetical protein